MTDHPYEGGAQNDDATPVDPDIALATDYLTKALSPEQSVAFEQRLRDDGAFFLKVAPVMKIWNTKARFGQAPAKQEPPQRGRVRPHATPRFMPIPDHAHFWAEARGWAATGAFALAALLAVVGAGLLSSRLHPRPRTSATNGFAMLPKNKRLQALPGDSLVAVLDDSTRVVLRNGALFTYAPVPFGTKGIMAALDGEATIEKRSTGPMLMVQTSAGILALKSGAYAIRSEPGSLDAVVTVGRGMVILPATFGNLPVAISAGEFGHVSKGGLGERTKGEGYPALPVRDSTPEVRR